MFWDPVNTEWRLELYDNKNIYATLKMFEYPLGTFTWTIHNDPCYGLNETAVEVPLSFNACDEDEFNCRDGICIYITQRCDGKTDCPDKSDEIYCNMVEIDESYLRDMPAPPKVKASQSEIKVSVDILALQEISEVESFLALQFDFHMTWYDSRIFLNNLKEDSNLNTVNSEDKASIWIPEVTFYNTLNKDESKVDSKAFVTVQRKG